MSQSPALNKSGIVVLAYNSSAQEVEPGGPQVQGPP